jgi:hypothetical protein
VAWFFGKSPVFRSPEQELRTQGIAKGQFNEFIDVNFPVSDTHQDSVGVSLLSLGDSSKTREPFVIFLLLDG